MGHPLEAILEKDGRLRLLNSDDLKGAIGQSFTILLVGVDDKSDPNADLNGYSSLSQPSLKALWEGEPDIEELWGDL